MSLKIKWLGTACFQIILSGDIHIVLDPYMDDSVNCAITSDIIGRCDYIFLTHGHFDHVLDVGKLASRFTPPIYCNAATAETLVEHQGVDPALIHQITSGDEVDIRGFKAEVFPGVHMNLSNEFKRLTGKEMPEPGEFDDPVDRLKAITKAFNGTDQISDSYPEWRKIYTGGEQLNFVFEGRDRQRLYVAGSYPDREVVAAAKKANAAITLLQCMSANKMRGIEQQTADVAIASGCKTVIPQHHDPIHKGSPLTDLSRLKGILTKQHHMAFLELIPGRWYVFDDGLTTGPSSGDG